jgi:hypothetical protein
MQLTIDECSAVFEQIRAEAEKASKQIGEKKIAVGKIKLSSSEKAKWPFLQPKIQGLMVELSHIKNNLMVMLLIAQLAHAEKLSLE